MGIEPTSSAWKAEVLAVELHPHLYTVNSCRNFWPGTFGPKPVESSGSAQSIANPSHQSQPPIQGCGQIHPKHPNRSIVVEGGGFEPPKAEPADLQSAPFDRSGTPPSAKFGHKTFNFRVMMKLCQYPKFTNPTCFTHLLPARETRPARFSYWFSAVRATRSLCTNTINCTCDPACDAFSPASRPGCGRGIPPGPTPPEATAAENPRHEKVTIHDGARRGTRTHDLLILTHYRFRGLSESGSR